jgi:hypothetical protein
MIEIEKNVYTEDLKENNPVKYRVISKLTVNSSEEEIKYFNGVNLGDNNEFVLTYNWPDNSLYIVAEKLLKINSETDKDFFSSLLATYNEKFKNVFKKEIRLNVLDKNIQLNVELNPEITEIGVFNLDIPKFQRLKDIIKDDSEEKLYSAFLKDELIFEELKRYCDYKKISYNPKATETIHLPFHKKLDEIDELYVSETLLGYLEQYFASQLYMSYEKNSAEFELGLLMYLDRKFSSYMFDNLKYCQEKQIESFWSDKKIADEFQKQLKQASTRVNKNPKLSAIAEKYTK